VASVFPAQIESKWLIYVPDGRNPGAARAMLCFPQMATKAQITAEQYLHMTFEHDAEFVHGEIVERSMPDRIHSLIQFLILMEIGRLIQSHPLFPYPELRLRLEPGVFRIPDISVFGGQPPQDDVPSTPPLITIEILSKDERHPNLVQKLEEYRIWGVQNVWVVYPLAKRLAVYTDWGFQYVSSLALPNYPLELTPGVLFSDL
jgi:Uma2 family endonuclease